MFLSDVLSQLAIFGATSIVLPGGWRLELEHADALVSGVHPSHRFHLAACGPWIIEILEVTTGRLFARAATLWPVHARHPRAAGAQR